jgi:hypothetical protein
MTPKRDFALMIAGNVFMDSAYAPNETQDGGCVFESLVWGVHVKFYIV